MSSKVINRITLFKIANEEDRDKALAAYTKLNAEQKKVVRPGPHRAARLGIIGRRRCNLFDGLRS